MGNAALILLKDLAGKIAFLHFDFGQVDRR
jgi:hypothetical protein